MKENKKVLIKTIGLKQYFPLKKKGQFVKANDGIDLAIYQDETFGLVGESGCGKSTFGRTLLQLYPQTAGQTIYYGRSAEGFPPDAIQDGGIDLTKLGYGEMRRLRRDLQLIFQDPYSSLNPRMTVGQLIGEALIAHGMYRRGDEGLQEYILKVMQECGLAPYMLHRYPHQFSGGQRQRIGIARSLALRPKFVVCDEAVSALDVSIQSQVLNLLMDLKKQAGLTYLFISHDLSVVKYISDRIGVMYLGNLVEMAPTGELFENTMHPYTEALLKAIPTTDADSKLNDENLLEGDIPSPANPPKGCKFHTRCPYATDICETVEPPFLEAAPGHFAACHHKLGRKEMECEKCSESIR